jgi:FtsP/CotA-like multicopper oxidase with cupredoxin domain
MRYALALVAFPIVAACVGCGSDDSTANATEPRSPLDPYPPTGETKEFELTITEGVRWEVGPGAIYDAIAYNEQIPGPPIEVNAGDRVLIHLTNDASEPHSIHTHVVEFSYENDGVDPPSLVMPGETQTIEWNAVYAGTFPYHDHGDEVEGIARGLFGALIVHAPDESPATEQLVVLSDFNQADYIQLPGVADPETGMFPEEGTYRGGHQYMHTINGKGYEDAVPPFRARVGDLVRWRVVSIGQEVHTWHVHGHRWLGSDGAVTDNVLLGPGMYTTFEFVEDKEGEWLTHCHVPNHMEGGMMARYIVEPF